MKPELAGLLGIARRAGKLQIGFDAVSASIKSRRARLVLLADDCSPKTAKELRFFAESHPCPLTRIPADKAAFSAALGLEKPVAAVSVDDAGFAAAMLKHCGTEQKEDVAL